MSVWSGLVYFHQTIVGLSFEKLRKIEAFRKGGERKEKGEAVEFRVY
jgi:hypothetical protein